MSNVIKLLSQKTGKYRGQGINHEGQPFIGELDLETDVVSGAISLTFSATGLDGTLYHREQTMIALSANERPSLWSINTNNPRMLQHDLKRETGENGAEETFVFGFGNPEERTGFREEIAIDLWSNGDVSYRYSWGMPGGAFEPRSGVRMRKIATIDIWHVALPVDNLEASIEFYHKKLGFTLVGRDEYPSKKQGFVAVQDGGFTIELFEPKENREIISSRRPDHLAFECHDIEAYWSRILANGLTDVPTIDAFDNGVKYFRLRDPNGVALEFFQGRELYERAITASHT